MHFSHSRKTPWLIYEEVLKLSEVLMYAFFIVFSLTIGFYSLTIQHRQDSHYFAGGLSHLKTNHIIPYCFSSVNIFTASVIIFVVFLH